MKKKILALVLSVLMVLSCCSAMVVFAEETTLSDNLDEDYEVTDVLEGNLFTDLTTSGNPQSDAHASSALTHAGIVLEGETKNESAALWTKGDVSSTNWNTGNGPDITSNRTVLDPWAVYADADGDDVYTLDETQVNYTYALAGSNLRCRELSEDGTTKTNVPYPTTEYTRNVVVRAPLTLKSGSGTAIMNIARIRTGGRDYVGVKDNNLNEYPIEYNGRDQGITVASSGTTYLNVTFAANPDLSSDPRYTYVLGMVMGTDAGITVHMDESEFYIGYEYAKDLEVTADKTKLFAGAGSITVDADVLNQLGNLGGLSQGVTWYALNEGRTEAVDGFTITPGEDGTAQVSAASTVAAGKYTLVAVADENSELVKGITITVADIANDTEKIAISNRTDNAITDPTGWGQNYYDIIGFSESATNNTYTIGAGAVDNYTDESKDAWAAAGLIMSKSKIDTSIYKPGATLVFSASVISHNTNNPKLTWGLKQVNYKSILPMEYPTRTAGFETVSGAWTRFGATVAIPENCDSLDNTQFNFGFSSHEASASGSYYVNINRSSMYLAEEAAAEIILTADKTSMYTFESINLDVEVLNQVGYTGNLSQDVTWYAMNADRTAIVPGITVTDGVVTADDTVASGEYDIVAVSEDNEVVKGITISIANLSKDFEKVPLSERTDNIILDKTGWGQTGGLGFAETSADNTTVYTISKSGATSQWEEDANAKWAAEGLSFKAKIDTSAYQPGATLVLSADVKSHNDNNPKLTWGMYQNSYKSLLPMEYPTRVDGFETSISYKTFGATVAIPETCDVIDNTLFSFGFAKQDAPESSNYAVNIKRDSLYLAVEAASDIKVTADKTTANAGQVSTVSLDADILNQVDYTGNLSQEVTWYAMNEARTEFVDEIQITEGANGTATATLPATLAAGTYNIVAVSDANKALVRTTTLTVEEAQITETTIAKDGTNVIISAKDSISNAILVFVQYDSNGRLVTADFTNDAVTVSANGTATIAIPAGFTTGNVKIMLWKDLTTFKPLAAAIE